MNKKERYRPREAWTESKIARIVILIAAALAGIAVVLWFPSCVTRFLCSNYNGCFSENLKGHLELVAISIPVLTALWYFRTYDTRQQIYHNIQNDLLKGFDNLASDNSLQVDIGVAMLLEISKKVPSFNEIIKLAFIRRLKNPLDNSGRKEKDYLSYAQYILRWLIDYKKKNKNINLNLNGMDLSYQEFSARNESKKIIFERLFDYDHLPIIFSFRDADPSGIDLINLQITHADGAVIEDLIPVNTPPAEAIVALSDKKFNNLKLKYRNNKQQ